MYYNCYTNHMILDSAWEECLSNLHLLRSWHDVNFWIKKTGMAELGFYELLLLFLTVNVLYFISFLSEEPGELLTLQYKEWGPLWEWFNRR